MASDRLDTALSSVIVVDEPDPDVPVTSMYLLMSLKPPDDELDDGSPSKKYNVPWLSDCDSPAVKLLESVTVVVLFVVGATSVSDDA